MKLLSKLKLQAICDTFFVQYMYVYMYVHTYVHTQNMPYFSSGENTALYICIGGI